MTCPDWFAAESEEFLEKCIEDEGFTILAKPSENPSALKPAGFFTVHFPGLSAKNMGHVLNLSDAGLLVTAHMDTAVVDPDYRGNHLQSRMLAEAEAELSRRSFRHLFATVHPDNIYSLRNVTGNGYRIIKTCEMYGGLPRHILYKEL